jgi:hypothetical protein
MGKKAKLKDIIKCCEVRFNRGVAADWKNSDFGDLSREIMRETEVNLSLSTLKRIFGKVSVDDEYLPQQATVDALIKYGRYSPAEPEQTSEKIPPEEPAATDKLGKAKSYKWLFIPSVIVLGVCVFLAVKTLTSGGNNLKGSITFAGTEGLLPATAFFTLQLPDIRDSLFIDFGDKSPLVYVMPGETKTAHNYLFPGVFTVTLRSGQNVIASTRVSIKSNKWIGLGFRRQVDIPNRYYEFPAVKTGPDSLFHITNGQLYKMGLDTVGSFFTRLCNFTAVKNASEDFLFEATFKNEVHEKGIYCNSTHFQIVGMEGRIHFELFSPGCSYRIINVVSEQTFTGSKENLSKFVLDLGKWNTVKLINRNRHVSLYVNDKLLFEGTYEKPIGAIQGLFLEFEGNGFVKACDLKTTDGNILYHF